MSLFYSKFIAKNMSPPVTGGQKVPLYCVLIRGENQILVKWSTHLVPGIVLRAFWIHLLIPSMILQSRDIYHQLILEQPDTQRHEAACSKLHSE